MTTTARLLTATPEEDAAAWGVAGLVAAIDRGGLADWRRISREVREAPHGQVAADLEQAIAVALDRGVAAYLSRALERARMSDAERLGQRMAEYVTRSGLSQAEFARRIGTSASRMSTYVRGRVVPSAVLVERMRVLAGG